MFTSIKQMKRHLAKILGVMFAIGAVFAFLAGCKTNGEQCKSQKYCNYVTHR